MMKNFNKLFLAAAALTVCLFASCNISGVSEAVEYTVFYGLQNIDNDEYTIDDTETLKGLAGEKIQTITQKYDGFTIQDYSEEKISKDANILIKFNRNTINLNLDFNGGSITDETGNVLNSTVLSGRYGAAAAYPVPVKTGYTLDGWYDSDENAAPEIFEKSGTYIASYVKQSNTYKVHHMLQNLDDDEYTEAEDDAETLYGTAGNETNASAKKYAGFVAQTITQETVKNDNSTEVNVYYNRKLITLYIDLDGGKGTEYVQGKFGKTLTEEDLGGLEATKSGYRFAGYNYSSDLTFSVENDEAKNLIKAVWIGADDASYLIKTYLEKAAYTSDEDKYELKDSYCGVGTAEEKTGFTKDDTGITVCELSLTYEGFVPAENEDITIAADDTSVLNLYFNRKTVSVTFDLAGGNIDGETTASLTGKYGETISETAVKELITAKVQKAGYEFSKWIDCPKTFPLTNCTVSAAWNGKSYQVTYKNSADSAEKTVWYTYGEEYIVPDKNTELPDKTKLNNFTGTGGISGWKLTSNSAEIEYNAGDTFSLPTSIIESGSLELYAVWSDNCYIVKHFKQNTARNGYDEVTGEQVTVYALAGTMTTAVPLTFEGFEVSTAEGYELKQVEVADITTASQTVVNIYYDRKAVKITFILNYGTAAVEMGLDDNDSKTGYYGTEYTYSSSMITRTDYSLSWKDKSPENDCVNGHYYYPAEDTSYEAVWTVQQYNITYENLNGQENSNPSTFTCITPDFDLKALDSLPGYSFEGWYSDEALTTKVITIKYGTKNDVTLYAKWHPETSLFSDSVKSVGDILFTDETVVNYIEGLDLSSLQYYSSKTPYAVVVENMAEEGETPDYRCLCLETGSETWDNYTYSHPTMYFAPSFSNLYGIKDGYNSKDIFADYLNSSVNCKSNGYSIGAYSSFEYAAYVWTRDYTNTSYPTAYRTDWYLPSTIEITNYVAKKDFLNRIRKYLNNLPANNIWNCDLNNIWTCNTTSDGCSIYYFNGSQIGTASTNTTGTRTCFAFHKVQ